MNFKNALQPCYETDEQLARFDHDLGYLIKAYKFTEALYQDNFSGIESIKLVVFAEAPLFGKEKSYIYNPGSKHTSFLWPPNLSLITGKQIKGWSKRDLIYALQRLGILIIDIFPYALNSKDTALIYKQLSEHQKKILACEVSDFHLRPKLEQVVNNGATNVRFCCRYEGIAKIAKDVYPPLLGELGIKPSSFSVISMQGGMIDIE